MKIQNAYKAKDLFDQQNYERHNLLARLRVNWASKYPEIHGETLILLENQKNYFAEMNDSNLPQQGIFDLIARVFPLLEDSFFALKSEHDSFFLPTGEKLEFACRGYSLQTQESLSLEERLKLTLEKKVKLSNPFGIFIPVLFTREENVFYLRGALGEIQES